MGPYKNRPLEQGLSGEKQKRGCENRNKQGPKSAGPWMGNRRVQKKRSPTPPWGAVWGFFVGPRMPQSEYYPLLALPLLSEFPPSVHSGARGAPNFLGPRKKYPPYTAPFTVRCPAFPGPRFHSFPGPHFSYPLPVPRSGSSVFAGRRLGPRFHEVISPQECEFLAILQC